MPLYHYKAVSREGETLEAECEAPDEATLLMRLQADGLLPIRIVQAGKQPLRFLLPGKKGARLKPKDINSFTRELLTLLEAGLPLDRGLQVLMELSEHNPPLNALVGRVLEVVKGGGQLSDALERQGQVFSRFYLNLIRAGEAGGALEEVLRRLSEYLERSRELRDTVTTAMIYPAVLLTLSVASMLLLLAFVVPQFTEMFESAGKELPLPTQIVVGVAQAVRDYWWVMFMLLLATYVAVRMQLADPVRRLQWDAMLLKLPLVGDLVSKLEVASFARTLATLLGNGVTLLSALTIVKETLGNRAIAGKIDLAIDSLKQGGGLAAPVSEAGVFPIMAVQMIRLGEESGHLAEMLDRVATTYDKEIKTAVQRLLALMEPVLIIFLGIVIGGIIISILMAIVSVNDLAF